MDIALFISDKLSFLWEIGIPFLVALSVLVFVHEWGHYYVARRCGVRVEVFSIGFGKELKGWTDKNGTRWKIAAIPLGGYVKMFGEGETVPVEGAENDEEERPLTDEEKEVSFYHKRLSQRAAIVFAGPAINFIFAAVAFAVLFMTIGVAQPIEDKPLAVVGAVQPGSAAAEAKLEKGDRIVRLGAEKITYFSDLQRVVRESADRPLETVLVRGDKEISLTLTPKPSEIENANGETIKVGLIGVMVDPGELVYERQDPLTATWMGVDRTYTMTARIIGFIGNIFTGEQSAKQLGGILRIAAISGEVAENGVAAFISFLAILSINLGLINLFPIPLLDGGHLAFYTIEAIRGRPLGPVAQEYGFRVGFALIVALFVFVTWNDIVFYKDKIIDHIMVM
jgi:regulator of sigma E protease